MNREGKYVIGEIRDEVLESMYGAIIVCPAVSHKSLVPLFTNISGAGFFKIKNGRVEAYGESTTLKLKANPASDSIFIEQALGIVRETNG
jgi:hypothetical protein